MPSITPSRDFSATPLIKKLGITGNMQIALIAAPDGFEELLGDLPEDTTLTQRLSPKSSLALCFIRSLQDLAADLVDYKVCSIDSDWSALKFARHKR